MEKAVSTVSEVLRTKPNSLPAWFTLANGAFQLEQWKDASECFQKILEISPGNPDAEEKLKISLERLEA